MKVSVIIPAHLETAAEIPWMDQAIDSALKQTYKDVEIVVINDHSGNKLLNWPKRRHPQDNIVWTTMDDKSGVSATRNFGVFMASGKMIFPLDHDDLMTEDCLEVMVEAWNNHGGIIYSDLVLFGDDFQKTWKCSDFNCNMFLQDVGIWNSSLYSKADLLKAGGWNENLSFLEDWDLNLRFVEHEVCGHHINKPLVWYRQRPTSRMAKLKADSNAWTLAYAKLRAAHYDFFNGRCKSMCCGGGTPVPPSDGGVKSRNAQPTGNLVLIKYVGSRRGGFGMAGTSGVRYWIPGAGQYVEVQNGGGMGVDPRDVQDFLRINGGRDFIQM